MTETLKRTSLYDVHKAAGAKLVPFAGFEMPVQYDSVIAEHKAVRATAGIFDVSHMGEFFVEGRDSTAWLDRMLSNEVSKVAIGQAQYNVMLYDNGTIVDDLIVYKRAPESWLVIVNAGNIAKDFAWMKKHVGEFGLDVRLSDHSEEWALLAVQGPEAAGILQTMTETRLAEIKTYRFAEGKIAGVPAILARTGYTGEDGFELALPSNEAPAIWKALVAKGVKQAGLGARDTLRLEMKYALYGNDIDETTNPLEAGLGWVVKMAKPAFVGKAALETIKKEGLTRRLVGFDMIDRGIPRHGYPIVDAESQDPIGIVTSGTQSPSLDRPIGVGYVDTAHGAIGAEIAVEMRGDARRAKVVETPFYKRPS